VLISPRMPITFFHSPEGIRAAHAPQSRSVVRFRGNGSGVLRLLRCGIVAALLLSGGAARSAYRVPSGFHVSLVSSRLILPGGVQQATEKDDCGKYEKKAVPSYRVARKVKPDESTGLELSISLDSSEFIYEKLVTLACRIGKDHVEEHALYVWILDDYRAAKDYSAGPIANGPNNNLSFRAVYRFSREKGNEIQTLTWWPDPADRDHGILIDLGVPPHK
jgi:hypothetical protein